MSFGEHLVELRNRLFRSAAAIVIAAVVGYFLSDRVLEALRVPIEQIQQTSG
ncbi:MAG TPA: twin-arginine translocase subunit TatC, partial [Glaciihabitans sp.]|nr:twin-arginine translocase subunit TatC [Glaciihabitans sp.]